MRRGETAWLFIFFCILSASSICHRLKVAGRQLAKGISQGQNPCNTIQGTWEMHLRAERQRRVQRLAWVCFLFPQPPLKGPGYVKPLLCIDVLEKTGTIFGRPWLILFYGFMTSSSHQNWMSSGDRERVDTMNPKEAKCFKSITLVI